MFLSNYRFENFPVRSTHGIFCKMFAILTLRVFCHAQAGRDDEMVVAILRRIPEVVRQTVPIIPVVSPAGLSPRLNASELICFRLAFPLYWRSQAERDWHAETGRLDAEEWVALRVQVLHTHPPRLTCNVV
jgi:hypothetical protein